MPTQPADRESASSSCGIDCVAQVYENDEELVVLVRLSEGLVELRVPRAAVAATTPPRHATGINANATPC
jgi:hypothetical protein